MSEQSLTFSVDNQLLGELGERLVAKNYVALAELIKNAYDADATEVTVTLLPNAKDGGEIVVSDVGQGMTCEEVKKYWMRVATDHKVREPRTRRFGRTKTGSKGIGRFACRRLAHRLELRSVAAVGSEFEVTRITFDWRSLKAGRELGKEQFIAYVHREKRATPGLQLRMTGLTEPWTQRDFNILRRSLVDVSIVRSEKRKGFEADPGFMVILESDSFKVDTPVLSEQYMDAGWGRMTCTIQANGAAELTLKAKSIGTTKFNLPGKFPLCAGVSFDVSWLPDKKEYLRDPSLLTDKVRTELGDQEGGIRVYLDGFRVYPYGSAGTDWLGISRRLARRITGVNKVLHDFARNLGVDGTRAMLDHPKETTLIGRVQITQAAKNFTIKMDREGFVENEAFEQLTAAVGLALEWMTVQYVHFKQQFNEDELRKALADDAAEGPDSAEERSPKTALDSAIDILEKAGNKGVDSLPGRNKAVKKAAGVVRRSAEVLDARIAKLQILASTGPMVFAFAHEIKSLVARIVTHANHLDGLAASLPKPLANGVHKIATDLRETRTRLNQQVALFGAFSKTLGEDRPLRQSVPDVVADIVNGFAYLTSTYGIGVDTDRIEAGVRTGPMRAAEFYSIVVNLLSNAVKACIAGRGHRIGVQCTREHKQIVLRVLDDGVGLERGNWTKVFVPLVSDPENSLYPKLARVIDDADLLTLGRGSGLGLSIVRDIVTQYGGAVRFIDPPKAWKTCVEVRLP